MNLEFNKIFAALLVAGITASSASFVSELVMHPHELKEDAVLVEGVEVVSGGEAAGPTGPEPIMNLIAAADIAKGEKLSKACAACHTFAKGDPNRVGPNLWNAVGHTKAAHADFAYSDTLKGMGGKWGYDELNHFLYKPKDYVSGTKMNFIGLKKPEDRADVIAWLRTMADSPLALPTESEIASEQAALAPAKQDNAAESGESPAQTTEVQQPNDTAHPQTEEQTPVEDAQKTETAPSIEEKAEESVTEKISGPAPAEDGVEKEKALENPAH